MRNSLKYILLGFIVIIASLGLGRFSFGMILPIMQADLNISTTQIGFVSTSNFIGYFLGVLSSNYLYSKLSTKKLLFSMLTLQAIFMYLMILFDNYLIISILYSIVGFTIAVSNISIIAYLSDVIQKKIKGKALGIVVSGNAVAIILAGFLIPYSKDNSWQYSWTILSLLVFFIAVVAFLMISDKQTNTTKAKNIKISIYFKSKKFWKISSLYAVFGVSYIIYLTYFVSVSIDKYELSTQTSGLYWAALGFSSLFSGFIFGHLADKVGVYKTFIYIFLIQLFANLLLVVNIPSQLLILSAVSFGITIWSVPALIALLCNQNFGNKKTAQVYALVTLIFSAAQIISPVFGGFIYDIYHDFSFVFILSSIFLFIGVILSLKYSKQSF